MRVFALCVEFWACPETQFWTFERDPTYRTDLSENNMISWFMRSGCWSPNGWGFKVLGDSKDILMVSLGESKVHYSQIVPERLPQPYRTRSHDYPVRNALKSPKLRSDCRIIFKFWFLDEINLLQGFLSDLVWITTSLCWFISSEKR